MASDDEIEMEEEEEVMEDVADHQWLQFAQGTIPHQRCARLLRMRMAPQRAIDWELLQEMGEIDRARAFTGVDTPWTRLFDCAYLPSYRLINVEFLSTFIYRPPAVHALRDDDAAPLPDIEFSLCGHYYRMSIERWAVLCGLYYEPETVTPLFTEGLTEMDDADLRAWWPTIGGDAFIDHRIRATLIRDPLVRYLHRCIATSITGRGASQEWVTMRDLFFLHCLMTGRPCNLARCLASYFASYYRRQVRGRIYGGSYITLVARARGYFDLLEQMAGVEPQRLDRRTLFGMQIVQEFPDIGLRFSLAAGVIWQPQHAHQQQQVQQQLLEPGQDPHPPPPPPPPQAPQPPQHPRHVYRAVRLPEQLERLLQEVVQSTRQTERRLDRLEDLVHWQIQVQIERSAREGTPPSSSTAATTLSRCTRSIRHSR